MRFSRREQRCSDSHRHAAGNWSASYRCKLHSSRAQKDPVLASQTLPSQQTSEHRRAPLCPSIGGLNWHISISSSIPGRTAQLLSFAIICPPLPRLPSYRDIIKEYATSLTDSQLSIYGQISYDIQNHGIKTGYQGILYCLDYINHSDMKEQSNPHEFMQSEEGNSLAETACTYCYESYPIELMDEHLFYCEVGKAMAVEEEHFECRLCYQQLTEKQLEVHVETCSEEYIKCFFCDGVMQKYIFNKHQCPYFAKYQQERNDMSKERLELMLEEQYVKSVCIWCKAKLKKAEQKYHSLSCCAKLTIRRTLAKCELTKLEYDNLKILYKSSARQHLEVQQVTIQKFKGLGYSQQDLKNMSKFIGQQAPLIIHCQLEKMLPYFLKDNYYRNLFETNHSGGSNSREKRMRWQEYLYGDLYTNAYDEERIKYGTINYTNDKYGIAKCKGYGYSVIVLKESVRIRCTVCDDRKYGPGEVVTTLMHNYPVLGLFKPDELKILHYAVKGFEIESNVLEQFKEIHVHGQIRLDRDVECIYTSEKTIEKMLTDVLKFEKLYGVKIIPFQAFFHQFVSPSYLEQ